jgi:hypothetical protein
MNFFNEKFNEFVRANAREPGFTLGNLDGRLRERPFATGFEEPDEENESMDVFNIKLMGWLKQMMYVSGETAEPSHETTGMVEEIVRQQVIEMVRDTRSISLNLCLGEPQRGSCPRMQEASIITRKSMLTHDSCAPAPRTQLGVVASPLPPTT